MMKHILRNKHLLSMVIVFITGCMPFLEGQKELKPPLAQTPVDTAAFHYSLGLHSYFNGKLDEAIAELEKARALDTKSTFLATELAILYSEKGDIQKAITLGEAVVQENDKDVDAHILLAGLYLSKKENEKALREYLKARELDPRHINALLYSGIIFGDLRDYEKA